MDIPSNDSDIFHQNSMHNIPLQLMKHVVNMDWTWGTAIYDSTYSKHWFMQENRHHCYTGPKNKPERGFVTDRATLKDSTQGHVNGAITNRRCLASLTKPQIYHKHLHTHLHHFTSTTIHPYKTQIVRGPAQHSGPWPPDHHISYRLGLHILNSTQLLSVHSLSDSALFLLFYIRHVYIFSIYGSVLSQD